MPPALLPLASPPQLLLIATYTFLRSCLPFWTGDHGQILDILRREEKDWWPRIGSEGLSELTSRNHDARDTRMYMIWEEIRSTLNQDHCCFSVSARHLRDRLRNVLSNLDQMSANGPSTRQAQWPSPPKTPLGSRGTVLLVCFSLLWYRAGQWKRTIPHSKTCFVKYLQKSSQLDRRPERPNNKYTRIKGKYSTI